MPMPVGIKNATSGDIVSAIDAIVYASSGKNFLGINVDGRLSSMSSSGNPDTFLIMRGGKRPSYAKRELEEIVSLLNDKGVDHGVIDKCRDILGKDVRPNYSKEEIDEAVSLFTAEGMKPKIVVDSSHGNSQKNHLKQAEVWRNVVEQRVDGNSAIVGAMIESYNESGSQKFREEFSGLNPDISITDACLGIEETEELLQWTYEKLS
jgi:3-deoxy-7-phosphoheptulonate synthase